VKRVLTAAEMRAVDAAAARDGMPGAVLMENAGEALARAAASVVGPHGRFFVLCGPGNNGGDGLVVARKLAAQGHPVFVELMGPPESLRDEPARNLEALIASGVTPAPIGDELAIGPGDVVIDALLGTGLSRPPEGAIGDAIGRISAWRATGAMVVSADLPSGLDSDTGEAYAPSVTADVTVSFGYLKLGQALEPGVSRCGRVELVDIGIPPRAAHAVLSEPPVWLLEERDVRGRLPRRGPDTHKGTYGHLLVVAGSRGKSGAAALAGLGALRAGAGLVTVATRPEALVPVMQHAPELMGLELSNEGALGPRDLNALLDAAEGKSALVIGPGIARDEGTTRLLSALLEELSVPCVLDADALNALAGHLEILRAAKADLLLTPHPGEMGRLLGLDARAVQQARVRTARAFAQEHGVTLVLKGARTLIARDDGAVFINPTGNPGMATGGTGDILAGVCGALLAQGVSAEDAAVASAYVHGLAGDHAARRRGQTGLVASDLLDGLCEVWTTWGL
jgi:NAD(P)H-hydrate epimerase